MALLIKSITKTLLSMKTLKYILPIFIFCVTGNSGLQAQASNITDFVTTWRVDAGDLDITIPTTGSGYSYSVDWGDNTAMSTGVTGDTMHSYTSAGEYEVRISGTFPRIYFNNAGDKDKIIEINQWGDQQWDSMNRAFTGASNLAGLATDTPNLSNVTDMAAMFLEATAFNQDISSWNVSSVTNMRFMFSDATVFDQDISTWNVSSVTDMAGMFAGVTVFDQDISTWNVSSVTDMAVMFLEATAFNQDISSWDVSSVTDMTFMFNGVTLSTANYDALLRGWSTLTLQSNVTFDGGNSTYCNAVARAMLDEAPNNWTITDNGQADGCSANASLSDLTLSTKALNETFVAATLAYTTSVGTSVTGTTITAPTTNTAATIDIAGIDTDGNALSVTGNTVSDLTLGANTITITVTAQTGVTRDYTITVTRVAPGDFFVTTWRVAAGESITIPTTGTEYNYTVDWGDGTDATDHTAADAMHTYTAAADYEVRIIGNFPRIYFNNTGDREKIIAITQWGTQQWTSMEGAFYGASNLAGQASDAPDLDNVTNMANMFDAAAIFNQNIGAWNVSNVTSMANMFDDAAVFNQNIGGWNVSAVTDMSSMFDDATAFDQDLGDWNVSSVTNMTSMLEGVTLSTANYDALLRGWSTLTLQGDVTFHGGTSTYCNAVAWAMLDEAPNSWTITDNGQDTGCSADASLSGLTLSTGALNETFAAATRAYTTSVGTSTETTITASTTNTAATIAITGTDTDGTALSLTDNTVSGLTPGANTITITITAQTGVTRDYTITATRIGPDDFFVTTWRVVAGDLDITIPTFGSGYNYTVNWGDGTPATTHSGTSTFSDPAADATHTYVAPGEYQVRISGDFPRIYFNNTGDKDKLLTVQQWGDISWTSMASAFFGCTNLTISATDAPDLTGVTDMQFMFNSASTFNRDISSWNVSKVTTMNYMFPNASGDISSWNVSKVTDMGGMFDNSGLSITNYDNLLTGWAALPSLQSSVRLGATGINYCTGTAGRNILINMHGWIITDAGLLYSTDITAFSFTEQTGAATIDGAAHTVAVEVVAGTTLANLIPAIAVSSGATIAPASGVAQDFSNDFVYTLTAQEDGITPQGWTVTVTEENAASGSVRTDITAFSFTEQTGSATIDRVAHTVAVEVVAGTTLTNLIPAIAVSSGATIAPASGVAQNFTNDFVYTVTAQEDGITPQGWTVTVTEENVAPADITLANSSINENNAVNDVIGGLSATDGNASDTHTYSLVAGTGDADNASFSISGSNLVAAVVFDYETRSPYSVRIAADDSNGGTFEKEFALTVTDVTNVSQTITFDALAAVTFRGASFDPGATASSGLPVSYSSSDGSAASVAGNMVTIVGAGTATITASQTGDDDYAAATVVAQSLVVNQANQTITLTPVTDKGTIDAPFDVAVSSTSGLPVTLTVSGPATISATTLTLTGDLGTVTITASQAGNDNYNAASPVVQSFEVVTKANQTIDFGALAAVTSGGADFNLTATASSGLPVSYSSSDFSVASVTGSTVTIVGAGTTDITASQAGDDDYAAATVVAQNLVVNKANQTITLTPVADKVMTDAPFEVAASSTSMLLVTFRVSGPATISGTTLTLNGTSGTVTITASQAGNSNYHVATPAEESFEVTLLPKQAQTITFGALAAMTFGGADFDLAATASLEVSYTSSDPSVASIAGNTVTIVGAGITVITASQAGDADYAAATDVAQSLMVNKADQTIDLTPVADKATTDAPFDVVVSSSSGLPVTFTVNGPATISGTTLTLAGTSGIVTITADQAGNNNYNAAPSVVQSFEVTLITGLEEEAPANKIILHPIPANNTIYIDMGDQKLLEMTVTDLNGKQMTVHAKDSQLDISSLKQGYYILRITTDQGVFSQKIIKQ